MCWYSIGSHWIIDDIYAYDSCLIHNKQTNKQTKQNKTQQNTTKQNTTQHNKTKQTKKTNKQIKPPAHPHASTPTHPPTHTNHTTTNETTLPPKKKVYTKNAHHQPPNKKPSIPIPYHKHGYSYHEPQSKNPITTQDTLGLPLFEVFRPLIAPTPWSITWWGSTASSSEMLSFQVSATDSPRLGRELSSRRRKRFLGWTGLLLMVAWCCWMLVVETKTTTPRSNSWFSLVVVVVFFFWRLCLEEEPTWNYTWREVETVGMFNFSYWRCFKKSWCIFEWFFQDPL